MIKDEQNAQYTKKWTLCSAQDVSPKFLTLCEPSFLCNNPCHVFCGCMDVASQQETIPKLSQMYAFFNLYCGCSTNVVPNSLRLFGSSFLLSFLFTKFVDTWNNPCWRLFNIHSTLILFAFALYTTDTSRRNHFRLIALFNVGIFHNFWVQDSPSKEIQSCAGHFSHISCKSGQ